MMPEPSTVATLQAWGRACLEQAPQADAMRRADARRESELLLGLALQRDRAWLFAHADETVGTAASACFAQLLSQRLEGVPVAHLLGEWGFWTLRLQVTPDTLIPRPETELLIEAALECLAVDGPTSGAAVAGTGRWRDDRTAGQPGRRSAMDARWRVADMGTGSGAIALALASECPLAQVVATDASPKALAVARANARRNDLANVEFREGDWYAPLRGERFDLIASNPPYIADADPHLTLGDLRYEPRSALVGGSDGLQAIGVLAAGAHAHLVPGGWLIVEHGYDQGNAVRGLFEHAGLADVQTRRDLEQRDRVTLARMP